MASKTIPDNLKVNQQLSPRETLIALINQKYGPQNAVVAESALKTQDKQIEQAMLENGMSAEEIMAAKGIEANGVADMNITVNKGFRNQSTQSSTAQSADTVSSQAPVTDSGLSYKKIPASSPFGFGGLTMNGNEVVEQNPGILAGLLSLVASGNTRTAARMDLASLIRLNKMQGGQEDATLLNENRRLEAKIKEKQLSLLSNEEPQTQLDGLYKEYNIAPDEQEDYQATIKNQNIRGMIVQKPVLERKKTLPAKELSDFTDMVSTSDDLSKNIKFLQDKGLEIGPGFSTTRGAIADMLAQNKGEDFATLKASIGRAFQKYRKWATGVAAGFPELQMLAPNYPKATDTNDVFIAKSLDVIADIERNKKTALDHFSNGGYAVSKLRKDSDLTSKIFGKSSGKTTSTEFIEHKSGLKYRIIK